MLIIKSITKKSVHYLQVVKLYEDSFPENERIDLDFMLNRVVNNKAEFYAYFDNEIFIGFAYNVFNDKMCFFLFLAIVEEYRGIGYGTQIVEIIKLSYKSIPIILAIEPVNKELENYEIKLTRQHFYLKNGFTYSGFYYLEFFEIYELLIWNGKIFQEDFDILMEEYTGLVMYSKIKPRLIKKKLM